MSVNQANTSSPQSTLISFGDSVNEAHQILMSAYEQFQGESRLFASSSVREQYKQARILFQRAGRCLDLSQVPTRLKRTKEIEGVLLLKEVLDRIELPPLAEIPNERFISNDEDFIRWRIPDTQIDIAKVEEGNRAGEFLFSPETVENIHDYYQKIAHFPYKAGATEGLYQFYISTPGSLIPSKLNIWFQNLPSWMHTTVSEQTLWQWSCLAISLVLLIWIPMKYISRLSKRISNLSPPQRTWALLLAPLVTAAVISVVGLFLDHWVNITGDVLIYVLVPLRFIFWLSVAIGVFISGNCLAETSVFYLKTRLKDIEPSAIRTIFQVASFFIALAVLIIGIERVGISLTPIIAGLGIGGLALALAGQKTVENIIAGLSLFADRPVQVGERCRFGDREGFIANIGLRSTRILALNGDLISIPNSTFSELELINRSRRDRTLIDQTIGLRYETTSEQLQYVLVKLREMILSHPRLQEDASRVRFIRYGDFSLDIEIYVYADTGDLQEFLGIQEDLLLRVKAIVEGAGTGFAFPSQTAYLSRDDGLNSELSRKAEAAVKEWRSQGVLPFPEFSDE